MVLIRKPRLLKADLSEDRRIEAVSWDVTENSTPLSTASISLAYGENVPDRAWVEVYTPNGSAGIFRVRTPNEGYGDQTSSVDLEHAITEVGDYLVEDTIEEEKALNTALAELFAHYTSSAGNNAHWQLASCSYTDTVAVDVDYDDVLSAMLDVLDQTPYYLTFDFSTTPWTVSVSAVDSNVSAEGRLSRNVLSCQITRDDTELATRVFASYTYEEDDQDKTAWVHDDASASLISQYGIIEKKLDDEYENATKAHAAAQKELAKNNRPKYSISISGFDFSSVTGETLDRVRCGKKYRFAIEGVSNPVEEVIKTVTWSGMPDNGFAVSISLSEQDDYLIKTLNSNKETEKSVKKSSRKASKKLNELSYDFYNEDGSLKSSLFMNYERLWTSFQDLDNGYKSQFEQTASHITWLLEDASGLRGQLIATASELRSEYTDANNGLRGLVTQTASELRSEYSDANNGLRSSISQTASQIALVVDDSGHINPNFMQAEIVAEVNKNGSEVRINANRVRVGSANSTVTLGDIITLENNFAKFQYPVYVGSSSSDRTTINGGTLTATHIDVKNGGSIRLYTNASGEHWDISKSTFNDWITSAVVQSANEVRLNNGAGTYMAISISGNQLVFKDKENNVMTFSKATTLNGSWDSGTYSVNASPQGNTVSTTLQIMSPIGGILRSGTNVSRSFTLYHGSDETHTSSTGFTQTITISAVSVYNACRSNMVIPTSDIGSYIDGNYAKITIGKPKADGASGTDDFEYTLNYNDSFQPSGSTSTIKAIELKYGSTVVARKTLSIGTTGYPKITYDSTNEKFVASIASSSSVSEYYIRTVVEGYDTTNQCLPVKVMYTESSSSDYGYVAKTRNLYVTDWSCTSLYNQNPSGYTEVVKSGNWNYYKKNNTSGLNTEILMILSPTITLDGVKVNSDYYYTTWLTYIPTNIYHDAYEAGVASGAGVYPKISHDSTNMKFVASTSASVQTKEFYYDIKLGTFNIATKILPCELHYSASPIEYPSSPGSVAHTFNLDLSSLWNVYPRITAYTETSTGANKFKAYIDGTQGISEYYVGAYQGALSNHVIPVNFCFSASPISSSNYGTTIYTWNVDTSGEYNSGRVYGFNQDHSMFINSGPGDTSATTTWELDPGASAYVYPAFTKTDGTVQTGLRCLVKAKNTVTVSLNQTPYVQSNQPSGYTNLGTVGASSGLQYVYFKLDINGVVKSFYIAVRV